MPNSTIERLARQMRAMERPRVTVTSCTSSSHGLDFTPPALVEWIVGEGPSGGAGSDGAGVVSLALSTVGIQDDQVIVVVDGQGTVYPPALTDSERLLVVRPRSAADAQWAAEQALRCPTVAATLFSADRLRSHQGRRLKLAVEQGGGLGLLVRPWQARRETCWADVRYVVRPRATASPDRSWLVEVAYRRGGLPGEVYEMVLNREANRLRVAPGLADAAAARRAS